MFIPVASTDHVSARAGDNMVITQGPEQHVVALTAMYFVGGVGVALQAN